MAPDPGIIIRTVGVNFEKLIPDEAHKAAIRDAVNRVHKATILATELLNLHVRRTLEELDGAGLENVFIGNWLIKAYYEVTACEVSTKGAPVVPSELRETRERFMPPFAPVDRKGLTQIMKSECDNLAVVAKNNIWMHFRKRVASHARRVHRLSEADLKALPKDEWRARKLQILQVGEDLCRPPSEQYRSPPHFHEWIRAERTRLGIDAAVGDWKDKPLLYHLKAHPTRFLSAMRLMSQEKEADAQLQSERPDGVKVGGAFALFPLRRSLVPRHIHLDQKALRQLLGLGDSEYKKARAKEAHQARKRRKTETGRIETESATLDAPAPKKRNRREKSELVDEKAEAFGQILDLRAAKLRQRDRFNWSFTTDGVCARLNCVHASQPNAGELKAMPKRGLFAIDELKRVSRLPDTHVVGIDPGVREIVVAVDQDNVKGTSVRYTQQERLRDQRSRQYEDERRREKPFEVSEAEHELARYNSRSASLATFAAYCAQRHTWLEACLSFYAQIGHRRRRWKKYIKTQQSESRLYKRLEDMHSKDDSRQLVLAYGSWGAVAGVGSSAVKRGNPPTIGVGLMRKLAKRFVVCLTPEHHTSSICNKCLGPCGPWAEMEEKMGKKIRGLRVCQDDRCKLPINRDRNGAANIGLNFSRLMEDKPPIKQMSNEELEFHRINCCMACDDV